MARITLKDALAKSLEMEEAGFSFYNIAAKKTASSTGRNIFKALAEDEKRHIEAIKKYSVGVIKNNKTPKFSTAMPAHKNIKERLLFGSGVVKMLAGVNAESDELKAYEIAMKMETDGYNFYKKAHDSIDDSNTKDLYEFLISEEKTHYTLIFDTYEYLKNPQDLFFKNEKPVIEG